MTTWLRAEGLFPLGAFLTMLLLAAVGCVGGSDRPQTADELHDRILAALHSDSQVLHMQFTFSESEDRPTEEFELWVDWPSMLAHEERHASGERSVRVVQNITESVRTNTNREVRRSVVSFVDGALPLGLHVFRTLVVRPNRDDRALTMSVTAGGAMLAEWRLSYESEGATTCVDIHLELNADTYQPIASWMTPCHPGDLGGADRLSIVRYELIEFVPHEAFPDTTPDLLEQ